MGVCLSGWLFGIRGYAGALAGMSSDMLLDMSLGMLREGIFGDGCGHVLRTLFLLGSLSKGSRAFSS